MASRKGIYISGHYVVSINAMPFHIWYFFFFERSDKIVFVFYIDFKTQRSSNKVF